MRGFARSIKRKRTEGTNATAGTRWPSVSTEEPGRESGTDTLKFTRFVNSVSRKVDTPKRRRFTTSIRCPVAVTIEMITSWLFASRVTHGSQQRWMIGGIRRIRNIHINHFEKYIF